MIYFLCTFSVVLAVFICWLLDDDGHLKKHKLHKYLDDIMYYQRHSDKKQIATTCKEKTFVVKADEYNKNSYYETIMLYINEEHALTLHVLKGCLFYSRVVEVNRTRNRREIVKIVKAAIKTAKKQQYNELQKLYNIGSNSYFK